MNDRASDRPARLLIVDDSRTIRAMLRTIAAGDPRLQVVGEATDPYEARAAIKALSPDVLTLDVEMPRMSGLDFLDRLMRLRPMPVVMVSTRTQGNSREAVRALALGAVDCIDLTRFRGNPEEAHRLAETIVIAAGASVHPHEALSAAAPGGAVPKRRYAWNGKVVLIGSSTGGVDALERVFRVFPPDGPPVLVAQHMPPSFLTSFADRLNDRFAPSVAVARSAEELALGRILLGAGGDSHIAMAPGRRLTAGPRRDDGDQLYVPSVDMLFRSALRHADKVVAVLLTGMGRDGAQAMAALRQAGATTIAQSGEDCIIDGMPRAARELGAAGQILPLDDIGPAILAACAAQQTELA